MDLFHKLCIANFLLIVSAIHQVSGDAMVTGTVFCDQCKDGQISLFDYPLYGTKVAMICQGTDGQPTTWGEQTTSWGGGYAMSFQGTPDLSTCYVQVLGNNGGPNGCGASTGPPKSLRLMFNMFNMEMYAVDPLLSQPAQPMSFCPKSSSSPIPVPNLPISPPNPPQNKVNPINPPLPPPVTTISPPLPPSPPAFLEASACPYQKWIMPEYRCNWKIVTPDTKVALAFGPIAAQRYGTDLTLHGAMLGRGEAYKTLLREGTTALLNSYTSLQFPYHPLDVIVHMNWALLGSTQQVLHTAIKFMRANLGNGGTHTCKLNQCK